MPLWLRLSIKVIIVFSASSFLWFLIGSTAYLQRGMDIIGSVYLLFVGIPVLLFAILLTRLLIKRWTPTSGVDYIGICVRLVISILLSAVLIYSVNSHGWTKEVIRSDSLKNTVDGKYEYRIEFINLFQRNSNSRLYLRDVGSGEEKYIPVSIQTREIVVLGVRDVNHWIVLEPTDKPTRYFLSTTKELGIPEEKFEIFTIEGISKRIE
ncbi:hypothetical protein [Paenibacillus assamensis]|uniref:hypothetical protein n=1 Tax=Paenibacillus assamensis TaxID=311244 RepID=UPI00040E52EF|nr:hypothetical protein [Paenibacillus assamensis]